MVPALGWCKRVIELLFIHSIPHLWTKKGQRYCYRRPLLVLPVVTSHWHLKQLHFTWPLLNMNVHKLGLISLKIKSQVAVKFGVTVYASNNKSGGVWKPWLSSRNWIITRKWHFWWSKLWPCSQLWCQMSVWWRHWRLSWTYAELREDQCAGHN